MPPSPLLSLLRVQEVSFYRECGGVYEIPVSPPNELPGCEIVVYFSNFLSRDCLTRFDVRYSNLFCFCLGEGGYLLTGGRGLFVSSRGSVGGREDGGGKPVFLWTVQHVQCFVRFPCPFRSGRFSRVFLRMKHCYSRVTGAGDEYGAIKKISCLFLLLRWW